ADRPVDFRGRSRRLKSIGEQKSLQRNGAYPEIFERCDVVRLQLKQSSLRDQHLRISCCHVAVAIQVQFVGSFCLWDHLLAVAFDRGLGGQVALEYRGRSLTKQQLYALL